MIAQILYFIHRKKRGNQRIIGNDRVLDLSLLFQKLSTLLMVFPKKAYAIEKSWQKDT